MKVNINLLNRQQGHTLLEMLIVLSVLGMISLVILPLYSASAAKQEIEYAIKQFEEDYFYVQQKAITESKILRIMTNPTPKQSYYYVQEIPEDNSPVKTLFSRRLPEHMTIKKEKSSNSSSNDIVIDNKGHWQGGRITFAYEFDGKSYRRQYIFQLHTGRFRIEHFEY